MCIDYKQKNVQITGPLVVYDCYNPPQGKPENLFYLDYYKKKSKQPGIQRHTYSEYKDSSPHGAVFFKPSEQCTMPQPSLYHFFLTNRFNFPRCSLHSARVILFRINRIL